MRKGRWWLKARSCFNSEAKTKLHIRWRIKNWDQILENLPDAEERLERISAMLAVESLLSFAADKKKNKKKKQDSSAFVMFSECSSKTTSGAQRTANVQTCIPDSTPEDVLPHQLEFRNVLIMNDIRVEWWLRQQVGPGKGWVHKGVPWKIRTVACSECSETTKPKRKTFRK